MEKELKEAIKKVKKVIIEPDWANEDIYREALETLIQHAEGSQLKNNIWTKLKDSAKEASTLKGYLILSSAIKWPEGFLSPTENEFQRGWNECISACQRAVREAEGK